MSTQHCQLTTHQGWDLLQAIYYNYYYYYIFEQLGRPMLQGTEHLLTYHSDATNPNISLQQIWHKTVGSAGALNLGLTVAKFKHMVTFGRMKAAQGFDCLPRSPFFTTTDGRKLSNSIASKAVAREMEAAGCPFKVTANTFRHSITTIVRTRVMVYHS